MSTLTASAFGHDIELMDTTNQYFNVLVKTPKARSKPVVFDSLASLSNIEVKLVRESDNVTLIHHQLAGGLIEVNTPKIGNIRFPLDASSLTLSGQYGDSCFLTVSLTGIFGTITLKHDSALHWSVFIRRGGN